MNREPEKDAGAVLVVDDVEENRDLLARRLARKGFDVDAAEDGPTALRRLADRPYDLVLLDVMMPGISGLEVLVKIRESQALSELPVIMVTAKDRSEDIVEALELGANDYIPKPIDFPVVLARVRTQLRLKRAEEMREALTQMIVHDLRNPLQSISGYLQLTEIAGFVPDKDEAREYHLGATAGVDKLMKMVTALLDVARLEEGKMPLELTPVSLADVVEEVETGLGSQLEEKRLTLDVSLPEGLPAVRADRDILCRIFENILGNGIKFSPEGGTLYLRSTAAGEGLRVEIEDEGPGIPAAFRDRVFERFGQIDARRQGKKYSTGLGLTFCKLAVETHGGRIGVESGPDRGSRFYFTLPVWDAVETAVASASADGISGSI